MLKRKRVTESAPSLNLFDQFLKKRNQNTGILQSQHETINAKVNSFQQLLRLTKYGSLMPRPQSSIPTQQKATISQNNQAHAPHNLEQKDEHSQETMMKFNKMASDINGWTSGKNDTKCQSSKGDNTVIRNGRKDEPLRAKKNKKNKHIQCNTTNISRLIQKNVISQDYKRIGKDYYIGNCKYNTNRNKNLTLIRGKQLTKQSRSKIQLAEPILMYEKEHEFQSLKNKIMQLEQKAKEKYGLKFEKNNQAQKQLVVEEHQHQLFLETRKDLLKDFTIKYNDLNYKKMVNEYIKEDSSIPTQLLGIIKSRSYKNFRPLSREGYGSRFIRI